MGAQKDVVMLKLDDIHPYENNPRINDDTASRLVDIIKEYGFKVPLVVDKNHVIISGHARYKAAKMMGLNEVPCMIADDLTEEQAREFRLVDNKAAEKAQWDFDELHHELEDLPDMEQYGFFVEDIARTHEKAEKKKSEEKVSVVCCPRCGKEVRI